MRKLSVLLGLVTSGMWLLAAATGQEAAPGVIYSKHRHFQIPFTIGPGQERLRQLQLYVSTDQGKTWQPNATASPDQRAFRFSTDRDGQYWFAVQTFDFDGRVYPPTMDGAQPSLRVIVESEPPIQHQELPLNVERRLINSKRINLNYEVKDSGPSGVSVVDLWYTQDGRSWSKHPQKVGDDAQRGTAVFDVNSEGLYGITLVAKSGVGLGERPPQMGDRPQLWIEVDLTKPFVQIVGVGVGQGQEKGKLTVSWTARDKNLSRDPIKISYAETTLGPWTAVVESQPNTGRYLWTMPERVPYQFYVKVEALDQAGNVGEAVTEQMVKVDLSLPKVRILNVEPAGR
jgi:hypothetical protein